MTSIFGENYDERFSISIEVFFESSSMHICSFYICRVNYVGLKILQNIHKYNLVSFISSDIT
jgi:hypothetical protein